MIGFKPVNNGEKVEFYTHVEVTVPSHFVLRLKFKFKKLRKVYNLPFLCFGPFLLPKISPHFINQNTLNVFVLRIIIPQRNKDQKKMSNIYIKILIHVLHVYVYYCNSLVLKKLESLK